MINILIIERENADLVVLKKVLHDLGDIHLLSVLNTIEDAMTYFQKGISPDLIISNEAFPEGCLVDTFTQLNLKTPIIFINDHTVPGAKKYELNCIDFITKPFSREGIARAINKYRKLDEYFRDKKGLMASTPYEKNTRSRIIVRRGLYFKTLHINDIICFYTQNKIVYAVTKEGQKFVYDKNLSDLEQSMDPSKFFRVNRQYVVNGHYINGFKNIDKIRIAIELPDVFEQKIIVSQDNAAAFRKWIYNSD